jgi:hypothetical protein
MYLNLVEKFYFVLSKAPDEMNPDWDDEKPSATFHT